MMESVTLILAAFLTSMLSAIIGMGGGVTLLGIMAIIMPEGYLVVAYHGIIQLVSNVTRATVYREHIERKIFNQYFFGIIPGLCIAAIIIYVLTELYSVSSANQIKFDYLKPLIGLLTISDGTRKPLLTSSSIIPSAISFSTTDLPDLLIRR